MEDKFIKNILSKIEGFSATEKLYYKASYETTFSADLLYAEEVGNSTFLLFDSTLFFPEEGGQTSDRGEIAFHIEDKTISSYVKNVIILSNNDTDYILHEISSKDFNLLKNVSLPIEVHGEIDWQHRFSNMQNHTGEHMFSGVVNKIFGYNNVGFRLSDNTVTMDFDGNMSDNDVLRVEKIVNNYIVNNIPVRTYYPTESEISALKFRSKIKVNSYLRITEIEEVDRCACCAPHVHFTGEIGLLIVLSSERYKGGTRISILCGKRALSYVKERQSILNSLSNDLKLPQEKTLDGVLKLKESISNLKKDILILQENLIKEKISRIPIDAENVCFVFDENINQKSKQHLINKFKEKYSYVLVLCKIGDKISFVLGSTSDSTLLLSDMKESLNAKGGGSKDMVQGTFSSKCESSGQAVDFKQFFINKHFSIID